MTNGSLNGSAEKPPIHAAIQVDGSFKGTPGDLDRIRWIKHYFDLHANCSYLTFSLLSETSAPPDQLGSALSGLIGQPVQLMNRGKITAVSNPAPCTITLAQNAFGREEILNAIKRVVKAKLESKMNSPITPELFSQFLALPNLPSPDLIIRTGSQGFLPDNMIWQMAYAEFWATSISWAELNERDLSHALSEFEGRSRRFGKVPIKASK